MKLTIILLTVIIVQVSATGLSQTVSFNGKNVSLREVLSAVKKQTGFSIAYNSGVLDKAEPVTLNVTNLPLKDFLQQVFYNQPLDYSIKNKAIFISHKVPEAERKYIDNVLAAPASLIRGRVLDANGQPLAGATVTVKNSKVSGITDAEGIFSINVSEGDIVRVSYIGYMGLSFKISAQSNGAMIASVVSSDASSLSETGSSSLVNIPGATTSLTITLKRNEDKLDEVVVNKGYYTESKRLTTGTVSAVKAADIEKQPVSNSLAALEGRVSGLLITQNSGMPGGGFTVQIRGRNSVAGGNSPFFIVDGVPFPAESIGSTSDLGANKSYNPLNSINPSDIQSIEILKDADATAIYGSRGANGVILITTKKGGSGKMKVDVNLSSGISKVGRKMDLLNTQQYLTMRHEAFNNDNATPQPWNYDLMQWDTTRYTDWQKELIGGTANFTDAKLSVSGGNNNIQYLVGAGYQRQTTVFPGDFSDQKASLHFNITTTSANQKFKIFLSGTYLKDQNKLSSNDLTGQAMSLAPDAPAIYDSLGNPNWENGTWSNPLAAQLQKYNGIVDNLMGKATLSYEVTKGLQVKANMGYTSLQSDEIRTNPLSSFNPLYAAFIPRSSFFSNHKIQTWIIEPQAEYVKEMGKGKLNVLVGSTFQNNLNKLTFLSTQGYLSDELLKNIQAASSISVLANQNINYRYNALFGRIGYNWDQKYLVNFTVRRDGSSRFGPGKRFANFGAIGAAWIFSEENGIQKELPFLSFGKLRASYGTTGNDQIPDYGYLDLWNSTSYSYGGNRGLLPNNLFNEDYGWERNKKLEAAIELGFFKNRILLTANYYSNQSDNQLTAIPLSAVAGFSSITGNLPAKVRNTGIEIELNTINVKSRNITWSTGFNITIPRNKLISFPGLSSSAYSYNYIIGQPLTIAQLFQFDKVDPQTGVYLYKDKNGAATSSPYFLTDRLAIKDLNPKFYGGLSNTVQYKGIELDVFFQFTKQLGRNYINSSYYAPGMAVNQPAIVLDRWQKPGDNTTVQKFTQDFGSAAYAAYSNAYNYGENGITDASFIRLKNLSLSYRLPEKWIQKTRLQSTKIYVQGQNLLTFTNYLGLDPENQSMSSLPPLRTITVGIQVTL